jgi:Flp pilus assembly protein CpaB
MIIAGLICGLFAAFLVTQKLGAADAKLASTTYLTIASDARVDALYTGDAIEEAHLGTIELPNSNDVFGLNARLVEDTQTNRTWIVGKRLNATIPPGRVLTYNLFEDLETERLDQIIPVGMRAFTINVSQENSLNNRVVPGNRVDLYGAVWNDEDQKYQVIELLVDVKVIAVGKSLSFDALQSGGSTNYSTITVALTPDEAKGLVAGREHIKGELMVLLRNQCDTSEPNATCG